MDGVRNSGLQRRMSKNIDSLAAFSSRRPDVLGIMEEPENIKIVKNSSNSLRYSVYGKFFNPEWKIWLSYKKFCWTGIIMSCWNSMLFPLNLCTIIYVSASQTWNQSNCWKSKTYFRWSIIYNNFVSIHCELICHWELKNNWELI